MSAKHTPGRWWVERLVPGVPHHPQCIAKMLGYYGTWAVYAEEGERVDAQQERANAHLMAAASELLAACEAALGVAWHEEGCESYELGEARCDCFRRALRAAITKARGDS